MLVHSVPNKACSNKEESLTSSTVGVCDHYDGRVSVDASGTNSGMQMFTVFVDGTIG